MYIVQPYAGHICTIHACKRLPMPVYARLCLYLCVMARRISTIYGVHLHTE